MNSTMTYDSMILLLAFGWFIEGMINLWTLSRIIRRLRKCEARLAQDK